MQVCLFHRDAALTPALSAAPSALRLIGLQVPNGNPIRHSIRRFRAFSGLAAALGASMPKQSNLGPRRWPARHAPSLLARALIENPAVKWTCRLSLHK